MSVSKLARFFCDRDANVGGEGGGGMEGIFGYQEIYRGGKDISPIMGLIESFCKLVPLIEEQNEALREAEAGLPLWLCTWQKLLPQDT